MAYNDPAYVELDERCASLAFQLLEAMAQRDALTIKVTDRRYTFSTCAGMATKAELARRAFYGKADYCPDRHARLTKIQAMATDFAARLREVEASAPATGRALAMAAE